MSAYVFLDIDFGLFQQKCGYTPEGVFASIGVCPGVRNSAPVTRAASDLSTLLRQPAKIDTTIVVWDVDLTAVDHRRVELVEQKLDVPSLRVPQNLQ